MNKIITTSILIVISVLLITWIIPWQIGDVQGTGLSSRFFPYALSIGILIFSIISLFSDIREYREQTHAVDEEEEEIVQKPNYLRVVAAVVLLILWVVLVPYTGYIVTTFVFTLVTMFLIGNKGWIQLLVTPLAFTFISYYLFGVLLNVSLP